MWKRQSWIKWWSQLEETKKMEERCTGAARRPQHGGDLWPPASLQHFFLGSRICSIMSPVFLKTACGINVLHPYFSKDTFIPSLHDW